MQGPQGTNVLLHVFLKRRGAVLALPVLSAGGSPGLLRAALWSGVLPCSPTPVSPQDECQQLALMTSAKFPSTFPASDVCQQAGSLFLHAASRNKEALYGYVCTRGDHYLEDF